MIFKNLITIVAFLISGCTFLLPAGTSSSVVTAVEVTERVKAGAEAVSIISTEKSLTDHAISHATGEDCKTLNVLEERPLCEEVNAVDK